MIITICYDPTLPNALACWHIANDYHDLLRSAIPNALACWHIAKAAAVRVTPCKSVIGVAFEVPNTEFQVKLFLHPQTRGLDMAC